MDSLRVALLGAFSAFRALCFCTRGTQLSMLRDSYLQTPADFGPAGYTYSGRTNDVVYTVA